MVGEAVWLERNVDLEAIEGGSSAPRGLGTKAVASALEQSHVPEGLAVQPGKMLPVEHVLAHACERRTDGAAQDGNPGERHLCGGYQCLGLRVSSVGVVF